MSDNPTPLTYSQLMDDLKAFGIPDGQTIMLHTSVNAIGDVMGGPNVILQALLDALSPTGTLMMYAGWQEIPDFLDEIPAELRPVYYEHYPVFDPATSRAVRENSILAEFLRTWPGTQRSLNPEASMVAWGRHATYLTQDHPVNYGYGTGSPVAKLVELNGHVLICGIPLSRITLLHHAEYCAKLRHKKVIRYQYPILRDGEKVWVEVEDYDTGEPHDKYSLGDITRAYLAQGKGRLGTVGHANAILFEAPDLTTFAIQWLESHFGV